MTASKGGHYSRVCWSPRKEEKGGKGGEGKCNSKGMGGDKGKRKIRRTHMCSSTRGQSGLTAWDASGARSPDECQCIHSAVDTGAGGIAWPENAKCGTELQSNRPVPGATGEIVEGGPNYKVICVSSLGQRLCTEGIFAPVCKPLLSVCAVTSKGRAALMLDEVGHHQTPQSDILEKLRSWFARHVERAHLGTIT